MRQQKLCKQEQNVNTDQYSMSDPHLIHAQSHYEAFSGELHKIEKKDRERVYGRGLENLIVR